MKRTLSLIMSFIMLLSVTAGIDFSAYAAGNTISYYQTNPLYSFEADRADKISFHKTAGTKAAASATSVKSDVLTTVEEASDFLREQMVNREPEIVVQIQSTEEDYNTLIVDIFNGAYSQSLSKNNVDGDYLRYNWGSYGVSGSYYKYPTYRVYVFTYSIDYYTTVEQEAEIQNEIDKIIRDNRLEYKSDYAKIKRIHDIVCDRIDYDYDGLETPDYTPQYTAYAALFDGKAVCQGYALLFYRLAKQLGLDVRLVSSTDHVWNIVKLEGKYYEVDCTWDDSSYDNPDAANGDYWSSGRVIYNYFLKGTSDFRDHIREAEFQTAEFNAAYPMAKTGYTCSHSVRVWALEENASCENGFIKAQICTNCELVLDAVEVPAGPHKYETSVIQPTENEQGYTKHTCTECGNTYNDNITGYASDNSALLAAIQKASRFDSVDYSAESFAVLESVSAKYADYPNQSLPQTEIDKAVYDILTAVSSLVPYLNLNVTGKNGTVSVSYDNNTANSGNYAMLFGTEITLTATPANGYAFAGWYETVTKRIFSADEVYTFIITSNTDFEALFVKENSALLIFANDNQQIQKMISKTTAEWNNVSSISSILPKVPYKLGFENGRWVYDNDDVLASLRSGESVVITPEYDETAYEYPDLPQITDGAPSLELYYQLDAANSVGSFTMALSVPENCQVESIGTAFYYKVADEFDPTDFELTISNKMLTSKFDTFDESGIYIVDLMNLTSTYNWAVRGYVTYYDADGNLKTAYTNQINISNRVQIN